MKIFTGLLKKAVEPLLGGPHFVVNGTKRKTKGSGLNAESRVIAHDNDPIITFFSTHKHKPKVKHTTIVQTGSEEIPSPMI